MMTPIQRSVLASALRAFLVCVGAIAGISAAGCDADSGPTSVATDTSTTTDTTGDTTTDGDAGALVGRPFGVATYNVQRFFDTRCDSSECGGSAFEALPSESQFSRRADELAAAMVALEADVLLLQEVETQACLDALTERLGSAYPGAVIGESGWAGSMDVAVIARWPIVRVETHADEPIPHPINGTTSFAREFLEVELDVEGNAVIVFVAHFKSKFDDDRWRRVAEATAAREIVSATIADRPDALVVMGGDLNDVPGSLAMDALVSNGVLFRVGSVLEPADDWTITYQGNRQAIDHILVPAAQPDRLQLGGVKVFRDTNVIGLGGGYGGSDHAALRAVVGVGSEETP